MLRRLEEGLGSADEESEAGSGGRAWGQLAAVALPCTRQELGFSSVYKAAGVRL